MIAVSEGNAFSLFNLLFPLRHLASDQESRGRMQPHHAKKDAIKRGRNHRK